MKIHRLKGWRFARVPLTLWTFKKFQEAISSQTHLKKKNFNFKNELRASRNGPDGPSGPQVIAGRPDAYVDPDTD